jgi:hypothetical protein
MHELYDIWNIGADAAGLIFVIRLSDLETCGIARDLCLSVTLGADLTGSVPFSDSYTNRDQ